MTPWTVIIPWSGTNGDDRLANLRHVAKKLSAHLRDGDRVFLACDAVPCSALPFEGVVCRDAWNKAALVNAAMLHHCQTHWALILDADMLIEFAWLRQQLDEHGQTFSVVMPFDRAYRLDRETTERVYDGEAPSGDHWPYAHTVCGGAFAIKRSLYLEARGFDERLWYAEDTDLSTRLRRLNSFRLLRMAAPAYHLWHGPQSYPAQNCLRLYDRRKRLNRARAAKDTVSCIPF